MIYLDMLRAVKCLIQCSDRQQSLTRKYMMHLKKKMIKAYRFHSYVCEPMCSAL